MAGHEHLRERGYAHHWGVGRHVLGSQIYDYWRDPFGNVVEHWTDGDLFNARERDRRGGDRGRRCAVSHWGPPAPSPFGA